LVKPTGDRWGGKVVGTKLVRNTSDKMVIRWTVMGSKSKSNQPVPSFGFRALYNKKTDQVSIIAKPVGYANDFRGKGVCVLK
jgi:hypothetical protein